MVFRNPDGGRALTASHAYEVWRCSTAVHPGASAKTTKVRPMTSAGAALDSRIGQACSRECRGNVTLIYNIYMYTYIYIYDGGYMHARR